MPRAKPADFGRARHPASRRLLRLGGPEARAAAPLLQMPTRPSHPLARATRARVRAQRGAARTAPLLARRRRYGGRKERQGSLRSLVRLRGQRRGPRRLRRAFPSSSLCTRPRPLPPPRRRNLALLRLQSLPSPAAWCSATLRPMSRPRCPRVRRGTDGTDFSRLDDVTGLDEARRRRPCTRRRPPAQPPSGLASRPPTRPLLAPRPPRRRAQEGRERGKSSQRTEQKAGGPGVAHARYSSVRSSSHSDKYLHGGEARAPCSSLAALAAHLPPPPLFHTLPSHGSWLAPSA